MSKLDEIDEHGWAESREDNDGKSVSMRVLPWSDYVLLTKAVRQLGEMRPILLALLDEGMVHDMDVSITRGGQTYGVNAQRYAIDAVDAVDPDVLKLIGGEE